MRAATILTFDEFLYLRGRLWLTIARHSAYMSLRVLAMNITSTYNYYYYCTQANTAGMLLQANCAALARRQLNGTSAQWCVSMLSKWHRHGTDGHRPMKCWLSQNICLAVYWVCFFSLSSYRSQRWWQRLAWNFAGWVMEGSSSLLGAVPPGDPPNPKFLA